MKEQHLVVFVEPAKVNLVLSDIAEAEGFACGIWPFALHDYPGGQVVMIDFSVQIESEASAVASLGWLEDTLGPNCIIF